MGTAITLSMMRKDFVFVGGCIGPGYETSKKALSDNAEKLFFFSDEKNESDPEFPGKNTEDSLRAGFMGFSGTHDEQATRRSAEGPAATTTG